MVDDDGKNCYPNDEIWMTDGYGDYVRHYLRAMAWRPDLAPSEQIHLLSSTSVIQLIEYPATLNKFPGSEVAENQAKKTILNYRTYDNKSTEVIRLISKPGSVLLNQTPLQENAREGEEGWSWKSLKSGGILTVSHITGNRIIILTN
jgi:hypothetical protein